jgi:hypothetical protein
MTSMEMDDEDQLDAVTPYPMPDKPKWPYGLRICLTHKELEKLGLDASEAFVGGIIHGHFLGKITSVSADDTESGSCCRVEIQIEALSIESEDAENEDED